MVGSPSVAWKLVLAAILVTAIILSASLRAPRHAVARTELRRLMLSALGLYVVGGFASLRHQSGLAVAVCAAGIVVSAFAAWLSRGADAEDRPAEEQPVEEQPPPAPGGVPGLDWGEFERAFRAYTDRASRSGREPARMP